MILDNFGECLEDASLEKYNTYGLKTKTKYLIKPDTIDKLVELIKYLHTENIKYIVLGKGSNVILPDNPFNGVIISLEKLNKIAINDNIVTAECGVLLNKLVNEVITNDLGGLENLATIPGTLGGALYGNAGVKDSSISDYLESVVVISHNRLVTLNKKDITFKYRDSSFKRENVVLVSATFKLQRANKEELMQTVAASTKMRNDTQPKGKSAGSVFKNPEGDAAGRIIDSLGLKGYNVGDAYISDKHANFIINKGICTSKDIKKLIAIVKEKVKNTYGIELELEQNIIEWD